MDEIGKAIVDILKRETRAISSHDLLKRLTDAGHPISQPTLSRRLTAMQADRYVHSRKVGLGLVHSYDPYHDWFSVPPQRRPKVGYDRTLLGNYIPNQTTWFTPDQIARLHQVSGVGRTLEASTYARAISQKLLVDLSYASSALEGNTYSYLDTQVLIEFGQAATGKDAIETRMILNHKAAILYLVENIADISINVWEIKAFHALLSQGLLPDSAASGAVRRRIVDIRGSAYVPMANPQMLEEEMGEIARKAVAIEDPFEQSVFLMAFVSYLQAFEDVNKRTARLACNIPLLKHGIAPLSFMEMDKTDYMRGLLSFYELRRPDVLAGAFFGGYVNSASRYDAYMVRDTALVELELRRRRDISSAVSDYVKKSVREGARPDLDAFLALTFASDEVETKNALVTRVRSIIATMHDGNHIAYGVPRDLFAAYTKTSNADLPSPG